MPTRPDPHATFWAVLEKKHGVTIPDPSQRPQRATQPPLTDANGNPAEPLPHEIPKD